MSTHGYSQNQIIVWKHPTMTKLATLTGHTFRVLYLAVSPDGQTIVTGAGERLLCWGSGTCLAWAGGYAGHWAEVKWWHFRLGTATMTVHSFSVPHLAVLPNRETPVTGAGAVVRGPRIGLVVSG